MVRVLVFFIFCILHIFSKRLSFFMSDQPLWTALFCQRILHLQDLGGKQREFRYSLSQLPLQLGCRHVTCALANRCTWNPLLSGEPGSKRHALEGSILGRTDAARTSIQCAAVQAVMSAPSIAVVSMEANLCFPQRSFSWATASHHHICRPCCLPHSMSLTESPKHPLIWSPSLCQHHYISLEYH